MLCSGSPEDPVHSAEYREVFKCQTKPMFARFVDSGIDLLSKLITPKGQRLTPWWIRGARGSLEQSDVRCMFS